jgi:hypothetical protein
VKPIEIYVDPATPSKWVRHVKQGVISVRWLTENGGEADPADRREAVGDADPIGSPTLGLKNLHRVMEMLIVLECGREAAALDCGSLLPPFSRARQRK